MRVDDNPVRIGIEQSGPHFTMTIELALDAVGLRAQYRALLVHLSNVPNPIVWDLSTSDMALIRRVKCQNAPPFIVHTVYGVRHDNALQLLFRNWGDPVDGLPILAEGLP